MSLYRLEFLKSGSVNIANGSDTITVTGSVDCSSVYSGTAIFIDNYQVVEAVSGTGFNPSTGESTIKLRSSWNNPTVTSGVLVGFNTFEGLNSAVSRLNEIIKSVPDFSGAVGNGLMEKLANGTYTIRDISDAANVLIPSSVKIPKVSDVHTLINSLDLASNSDVTAKIQSFGLGTQTPSLVSDLNSPEMSPTSFKTVSVDTLNRPNGVVIGTLLHSSRFTATTSTELDGSMLLIGTDPTRSALKIYAKFDYDRDASLSNFEEVYHSGVKLQSSTLDSYTVATLPSASANQYRQVFVTDLAGQAAPCYSDGTNWRRYSDNTIAS